MALESSAVWTMSPAASEVSTRSWTRVSTRRAAPECFLDSALRATRLVGSTRRGLCRSMSWLDVGHAVDEPDDPSLECLAVLLGPVCGRIPVPRGGRQVEGAADPSSASTTWRECSLWRKASPPWRRSASETAVSPVCPNGGRPRCRGRGSITSVRSSFRRSARATGPRDAADLEGVGEPRLVAVPLGRESTCVFDLSRRNALEWTGSWAPIVLERCCGGAARRSAAVGARRVGGAGREPVESVACFEGVDGGSGRSGRRRPVALLIEVARQRCGRGGRRAGSRRAPPTTPR